MFDPNIHIYKECPHCLHWDHPLGCHADFPTFQACKKSHERDILKQFKDTFQKACDLLGRKCDYSPMTYSPSLSIKSYSSELVEAKLKLTPEELKKVVDLLKK